MSVALGNWSDNPCWYASIQDAGRTALLLGPFQTEAACRAWSYWDEAQGGDRAKHKQLVDRAEALDPKAWFYAWGMVKMPNGHRDGALAKYFPETHVGL